MKEKNTISWHLSESGGGAGSGMRRDILVMSTVPVVGSQTDTKGNTTHALGKTRLGSTIYTGWNKFIT